MQTDNIDTLRTEMFATLRGLKDKTISIDQAKAIVEVGKVIIETAKAETDFLRVAGKKKGTGFIPVEDVSTGHPRLQEPETNGKGYAGAPRLGHGSSDRAGK